MEKLYICKGHDNCNRTCLHKIPHKHRSINCGVICEKQRHLGLFKCVSTQKPMNRNGANE